MTNMPSLTILNTCKSLHSLCQRMVIPKTSFLHNNSMVGCLVKSAIEQLLVQQELAIFIQLFLNETNDH